MSRVSREIQREDAVAPLWKHCPLSLQLSLLCQMRQCDNYNLKSHRRCNNMSRMNLSGCVRHVTILSWMLTIAFCSAVGLGLGLDLVSGKLLCTRICATLGCNCHRPTIWWLAGVTHIPRRRSDRVICVRAPRPRNYCPLCRWLVVYIDSDWTGLIRFRHTRVRGTLYERLSAMCECQSSARLVVYRNGG